MARLFNALSFSIHCKIIFISRQNSFVCALLKYLKSLGSSQYLHALFLEYIALARTWPFAPFAHSSFLFLGNCLYLVVVRLDQNAHGGCYFRNN